MIGALFGVCAYTAATGANVEVSVEGVFTLPKPNSAVAFAVGERIFWDDTAKLCKKTATGYFPIGIATVAAGATDATVTVRLDGNSVVAAQRDDPHEHPARQSRCAARAGIRGPAGETVPAGA
jgi:predicted RecA/RadA family phage recombinase